MISRSLVVISLSMFLVSGWGLRAKAQQTGNATLRFDVVSMKPYKADPSAQRVITTTACRGVDSPRTADTIVPHGRCLFFHQTLRTMIRFAYPISPVLSGESQIVGGPDWIDSPFYQGEAESATPETSTDEQLRQMVQTLLADRFKLAFHKETRTRDGYALVVANGGAKTAA